MNIIYSLSELEDWLAIAENMKKTEGWNPVMWISTETLLPKIEEVFPDCMVQEYIHGNIAKLSDTSYMDYGLPLDRDILERYLKYEVIVLKMMDRLELYRGSFTYNERVEHYYTLLRYWLHILSNNTVDYVLFNEFPHSPFDYILYAVAKENDITILRLAPTHVDSRVLLAGTLEEGIYTLTNKPIANTELNQKLIEYIDKLEGNYKEAIPFYMNTIVDKSISLKNLKERILQAVRYVKNPPSTPLKARSSFILNSKFSGIYIGYYRIKGNIYKKRLQKEYESLAHTVDLSKKYIYVPLHYQPEKTTSPEGDFFVDQYLMVAMISKYLPAGWKIYVKEHISQFSKKLYGERGRDLSFYKRLSQVEHVELVPLSCQSFDLIDGSKAVATVTGTAALEAINRDKYAFIFGYPWFQECEGIIRIDSNSALKQHLSIIDDTQNPSKNKIRTFFKYVENNSVRGYTGAGQNISISGLSREENIKNITSLLKLYISFHDAK